MRDAFTFLCASALLSAGLYLSYMQFFLANAIDGLTAAAAVVMTIGGIVWLLTEFVLPMMRKRSGRVA